MCKNWKIVLLPAAATLLTVSFPEQALCQAGWKSLPAATAITSCPHFADIACGSARLRLQALTPEIVRIRVAADGRFPPENSFVLKDEVAQKSMKMRLLETRGQATFDTGKIKICINKNPLRVIFQDENGDAICADAIAHPPAFNGTGFEVSKESPPDEHYFGLGDKTGPFDRRNQCFTNWNLDPPYFQESSDPIYKSIPFFLAMRNGKSYGIYLNNTYRSFFDFGKRERNTYSFGAEGGELDYFFIYGPHPKTVVGNFTWLTGRMPIPPLFALGYQQSRGSYIPQARVEEVAAELRSHKIPCDVIYLDGDYKQDAHPFTVDRKLFPDFAGLMHKLASQGFKTVVSLDPYIARCPGKPFAEGVTGGYFVKNPDGTIYTGKVWPGQVAFADFCSTKARRWWGSLHADFVRAGVRGIWDDMNEPAVFETIERTVPLHAVHDLDGLKCEHKEVHNIFGMLNTRATYEGLRTLMPDLRPFVLTRSGFAGSQRYAATWTGDNYATWNHMRLSVPQLLNLGLSGFCFAGDDIGGFSGFSSGPSPELLTRWMQLGAFNPLYRNHSNGDTRNREPWVDGEVHEASRRRFIEERYRLLPYIYSCIEECSRTGIPLMRPMFLEFPHEKTLALEADQFMFGPALLVAPKLWEMDGPYPVRLPPGQWYDYFTGKVITPAGTKNLDVNPGISELPVFARGGTVVARQELVQHTGQTPSGPLELRVYADAEGAQGDFYFDDGETMNYLKGEKLKVQVRARRAAGAMSFQIEAQGSYEPWFREVELRIYGLPLSIREVIADGKTNKQWSWSDNALVVRLPFSKSGNRVVLSL